VLVTVELARTAKSPAAPKGTLAWAKQQAVERSKMLKVFKSTPFAAESSIARNIRRGGH
jgi:hypothetical protein